MRRRLQSATALAGLLDLVGEVVGACAILVAARYSSWQATDEPTHLRIVRPDDPVVSRDRR